jgi:hypothetical protein
MPVSIVVGRIGDALTSEAQAVTGEAFTSNVKIFMNESFISSLDKPVKLLHGDIVDLYYGVSEAALEGPPGPGDFIDSSNYTLNLKTGIITCLSTGLMTDNTEYFAFYVSAPPIPLAHKNIVAGSVVVQEEGESALEENTDYTVDYANGTITAVFAGVPSGMGDATLYAVSYDWVIPNLAYKINQVTTAAASVEWVCTTRAGRNGIATIVYTSGA